MEYYYSINNLARSSRASCLVPPCTEARRFPSVSFFYFAGSKIKVCCVYIAIVLCKNGMIMKNSVHQNCYFLRQFVFGITIIIRRVRRRDTVGETQYRNLNRTIFLLVWIVNL